jgi:hypothetical protein
VSKIRIKWSNVNKGVKARRQRSGRMGEGETAHQGLPIRVFTNKRKINIMVYNTE